MLQHLSVRCTEHAHNLGPDSRADSSVESMCASILQHKHQMHVCIAAYIAVRAARGLGFLR